MVDEEKLRDLHGDELRKINQNGMLPLIIAHLFSLSLIRDIFGRQMAAGQGARQQAPASATDAERLSDGFATLEHGGRTPGS